MLISSQKSMVYHYIYKAIRILGDYFLKEKDQNYADMIKCINEACEENYPNEVVLPKDIDRIQQELKAMFNPDFHRLVELGVINSIRDKEEVVKEKSFPKKAQEIKDFATQMLNQAIDEMELQSIKSHIAILKRGSAEHFTYRRL